MCDCMYSHIGQMFVFVIVCLQSFYFYFIPLLLLIPFAFGNIILGVIIKISRDK